MEYYSKLDLSKNDADTLLLLSIKHLLSKKGRDDTNSIHQVKSIILNNYETMHTRMKRDIIILLKEKENKPTFSPMWKEVIKLDEELKTKVVKAEDINIGIKTTFKSSTPDTFRTTKIDTNTPEYKALQNDKGTKKYHVTYYYLATGMEGNADVRDYGIIYADNEKNAREKVAYYYDANSRAIPYPTNESYRLWGLNAKYLGENK